MATGILLLSFSCEKETIIDPPIIGDDPIVEETGANDSTGIMEIPIGSDVALANFFSTNIEAATQHFSQNANAVISLTGEKGTYLSLAPNSLIDADGDLITGLVDIELIEVSKKSEMVLMNKATMGKKGPNHTTLISQGEFYVSISQFGTELTLTSPMTLSTPIDDYDPSMRKFVNISDEEDLLWEMAADSILNEGEDSTGVALSYEILPGEWGWTNIDKFYSDPRPKTEIFAELPEGFDDTNTEVYISYDGESNALAQFDVWTGDRFSEHYGLIPIGLEVHFIAVGIVGDELNCSIQSATIIDNHVQNIDDFAAITEDALITLIDALP
ncbi:MAG: hypothetical protein P8I55_00135 [Crocinitomix sp.]|nr:hypothetical protein [Crocinitomix sp.]